MTLLADSAYAKNHPDWALKNSYQKRDPAFSGLVLYFTPKGGYVSGYAFRNGQQVIRGTENTTTATTASRQGQLTRSFRPRTQVETIYDCTFYYILELDSWGNIISQTFFYAECYSESGGGTDGSGSSGAPSGGLPPPPQCQPGTASPSAVTNSHSLTRVAQPPPGGGDGGMPPPQPCPTQTVTQPEVSSVNTITDSVTNPCLKAVIDNLTNTQTLQTDVTNILRNTFGVNDQVNITFDEADLTNTNVGQGAANTTGAQKNNFVVTFNTPVIKNASKEYLMETTMHEIFHAYLYANPSIKGTFTQHQYMINDYVDSEVITLQQVFPNLSTHDAQCLVLSGYSDLDQATLNSTIACYGLTANDISTTNNNFKTAAAGTKC